MLCATSLIPQASKAYTDKPKLDTRIFVVIGEDIAAGIGDFSLSEDVQKWSFPAQMARQFGTSFSQPLFQPPGVGDAPGLGVQPAIVPGVQQTTVLKKFPLDGIPNNLSVPGFTVADALNRRPAPPLIHRSDARQTLVNLILGGSSMPTGGPPLSQMESALRLKPTLVMVELGYSEAIQATVANNPELVPNAGRFRNDYDRLIRSLRETGAKVLLTTIPDPKDSAYLSSLAVAGQLTKADRTLLCELYDLKPDDLITVAGLMEIGYQLTGRCVEKPLPNGSVISASTAANITHRVEALNAEIASIAQEQNALLYDLNDFFRRVKADSVEAGPKKLNGDFLGGFFLLNGFYPGITGHALIANDILQVLNREFGTSFSPVDIELALARDPTPLAKPSVGSNFTKDKLRPLTLFDIPKLPALDNSNVVGFFPATTLKGCNPPSGVPGCGLPDPDLKTPLRLPPGLRQILPVNQSASYYGDALRVVDCPDDKPLPGFEGYPSFGTCGNVLFGGLAMGDANIKGEVQIKFSDARDNITHFEITHPRMLIGEDTTLIAPKLFRLPMRLNVLRDAPGLVSSGDLDLNTGRVTNLQYYTTIFNTALWALIGVNPNIPKRPLAFPGPGGSVSAKFEQRSDGLLDLTMSINGFLPLGARLSGDVVRIPLPLCSPDLQCASIVTRGSALHPHIHFSTKASGVAACGSSCAILPENTIQEFTPFVNNNYFGDTFGLRSKELGGPATGRSRLLGRIQVQFGKRFGDTLPIAITTLQPGGLLAPAPDLLTKMPDGVSPGLAGFDETLKFPNYSYRLRQLGFTSDPWNISLAAIDLKTGHVVGDLLYRGFVLQELMFNLLEVEPCTPRTSFCYQGPAVFARGENGETILRYNGRVLVPYPGGYKFPAPDGKTAFVAGPGSRLDPFFRIEAMRVQDPPQAILRGGGNRVQSSLNQQFSYRYSIPCGLATDSVSFDYTNHTQHRTFRMTSLSWVSCTYSKNPMQRGEPDTVTFTGFGTWGGDGANLHQVAAQISTAAGSPYVGIAIDGGVTSNVNTRPAKKEDRFPKKQDLRLKP